MSGIKAIKEEKRKAAELRQAAYDKLTLDQKLAKAGTKEKLKLMKKVQELKNERK